MIENSAIFDPDQNLLPNLLLIGANKAGTTSLHVYLSEHPDIFMSSIKEPMFFCNWGKNEQLRDELERKIAPYFFNDIKKYQELFACAKTYKIRGESSTAYLSDTTCAAKMKELIPDIKIIAVLRNPAERAFSSYVWHRAGRYEKKRFQDCIEEEIKTGRPSYPKGMHYLSLGKYSESLKTYFNLFPPKQVRVYLYDDLQADPKNLLKNIFEFLEVDSTFVPDLAKKYNNAYIKRYAKRPKVDKILHWVQKMFKKFKIPFLEKKIMAYRFYKPVLKKKTKEKLVAYYTEEISELERLLGRDLSAWGS